MASHRFRGLNAEIFISGKNIKEQLFKVFGSYQRRSIGIQLIAVRPSSHKAQVSRGNLAFVIAGIGENDLYKITFGISGLVNTTAFWPLHMVCEAVHSLAVGWRKRKLSNTAKSEISHTHIDPVVYTVVHHAHMHAAHIQRAVFQLCGYDQQ